MVHGHDVEVLEPRRLLSGAADGVTNAGGPIGAGDAELRDYIIANEGANSFAYRDTDGTPSIGVSFNLRQRGAKALIQSLGLDYKTLLRQVKTPQREDAISTTQAMDLFNIDLPVAIDGARRYVSTFDSLSHRQQVALVDIVFNVGAKTFKGMQKVIRAINASDFAHTSEEIAKSKYATKWVNADHAQATIELIQSITDVNSPTPTPTPIPTDFPDVVATQSPTQAVHISSGKVTLPDGTTVNVAAGDVNIDDPLITPKTYHNGAPAVYASQSDSTRWPDYAANLVPTLDTLMLGGLYHGVIPSSVVVKNDDTGQTYTRDVDYKLNEDWGQVMQIGSRMGAPGVGHFSIDYDVIWQRLDLIQVLPNGTVAVKKGTPAITCPALPEPDSGAVGLAGVFVYTLDGAKYNGFAIQNRDIFPIHPAAPVMPTNPDAIPNTLAKLHAGGSVNIAYFGDSITDGAEAGPWWNDRSKTYTDLVTAGLRSRFPSATITETLASQGGKGATDSQDVFQSKVLDPDAAGTPIDLVVIAMGMNDKGKPNLDSFKQAMNDYIDKARAAGMEVLLVTPLQSNIYYEPSQTDRAPRADIANAIREIADDRNATCIDMYTEWANQATHGVAPFSQLHNTFNHPGTAGQMLYADTILRAFPS